MSFETILYRLLSTAAVLFVSHALWQLYASPLKAFPGPLAAKLTNLWRFFDVASGRPDITQKALHQQYGAAVRIGPNMISLSDPSLIKTIYNIKGNFIKSEFYTVNDILANGHRVSNLFGTRSNEYHAAQVKPIQKHYTMNSVLTCEPLVDKTTKRFLEVLDSRFVSPHKKCDIGEWIEYYAWDNIGDITFGEPIGFLDKGTDIDGILSGAESSLDYFAAIGQIPGLDYLFDKNPVKRIGPPSFGAVVGIAVQRLVARLQSAGQRSDITQKDFLDWFIEKMGQADWINDNQVIGWLMINLMAGADTTAITMRAVVYYILKNPIVLRKLRAELQDAKLSMPVTYKAASSLPYLTAIIQESCRMHPGVGLPLERVVPAEGLPLADGRMVPAGTIVGMNAWVVHGNKEVYGQDADSFNPDRWLRNEAMGETEQAFTARRSRMKDADLTFGAGNRVCLGKHISLLEIYKLIATLFNEYDIELLDQNKDWKVQNSWFVRQTGIEVSISKRTLS